MKKFFKKLFSLITVTLLVGNFILPVSVLAATDTASAVVQSGEQVLATEVSTQPSSSVVSPTVDSVSLFSGNEGNPGWAREKVYIYVVIGMSAPLGTGDALPTVDLKDAASTALSPIEPAAPISSSSYKYKYLITENTAEGPVSLSVVDSTVTPQGSVIVDKTPPVISKHSPIQVSGYRGLNILNDGGIDVIEASQKVDVATTWSVPIANADGSYTYDVEYKVTDQAGNASSPVLVKVNLENGFVDTRMSSDIVTLKEDSKNINPDLTVIPTHAELGKVYTDLGATIDWSVLAPTTNTVSVWTGGDLNTLIARNGYALKYGAMPVTTPATVPTLDASKTRTINVSDTTIPGAVTNFKVVAGNGYIDLFWANPTDIDFAGVQIWKSIDPGVKGDLLLTTSPGTVSYEDTNVTNGLTYYYTLVAFDINGNSSVNSPQLAATPLSPQIASTDYTFVPNASSDQETTEVKGGTNTPVETKKDENKNTKILGLQWYWWVMILVIIAGGIYYRYQYPSKPTPPVKKKRKK